MSDTEGDLLLPAVDLDKSYDIARTLSASDLPALEGLLSESLTPPSDPVKARCPTPLMPSSPFLEHYPHTFQEKPFLSHADERVPAFLVDSPLAVQTSTKHAATAVLQGSPLLCTASSLSNEDSPPFGCAFNSVQQQRFSSLNSDSSTIRNFMLPVLKTMEIGDSGTLDRDGEPLGCHDEVEANGHGEEEVEEEVEEEEEEDEDGLERAAVRDSDSDYRPPGEFGGADTRRSMRQRRPSGRSTAASLADTYEKGGGTRKVGRPITYKGDPESEVLTEEERRRIKRRIANRESARRVRQKRQDLMEELQMSIVHMQQQNAKLLGHCGRLEGQKAAVMGQVADMQDKYSQAAAESARLQREICTLRKTLDVNMRFMEKAGLAHASSCPPYFCYNTSYHTGALDCVTMGSHDDTPSSMTSPFKTAFHSYSTSAPLWT